MHLNLALCKFIYSIKYVLGFLYKCVLDTYTNKNMLDITMQNVFDFHENIVALLFVYSSCTTFVDWSHFAVLYRYKTNLSQKKFK